MSSYALATVNRFFNYAVCTCRCVQSCLLIVVNCVGFSFSVSCQISASCAAVVTELSDGCLTLSVSVIALFDLSLKLTASVKELLCQ